MEHHYRRQAHFDNSVHVVRGIGIASIFSLVWLNGLALVMQSVAHLPSGLLIWGFLAAWGAAANSYLSAQLYAGFPDVLDTLPFLLVVALVLSPIVLTIVSLVCFVLGLQAPAPAGA